MPIRVLDPIMAAQIAAGEVIERPASVVKELVENALDAGADRIAVEVVGGGSRLIRVTDNGAGIPRDEAEMAFQRHATSKIARAEDLTNIGTLGFRGEALPSIAAVAEVTLVTRTAQDPAGFFLRIRSGQVLERGPRGAPPGTTVTVRNLFRDLPARRKFLKSITTESGHISHLVSQFCLAFSQVHFTLAMDGRRTLQAPGTGRLGDALGAVYGLETASALLEVGGAESPQPASIPRVWGAISPPSLTRANRSHLQFFVNRRGVQSRTLSYAVEEAYHGLLMAGRYPIAVLHLALPLEEVDVNAHPAKREVRFLREREVFALVQRAVRGTLMEQASVPQLRSMSREAVTQRSPFLAAPASQRNPNLALPEQGASPAAPALLPLQERGREVPIMRVLGQLSSTYIIAEGPDGMYLVDQHAAHERVLFERVQAQRSGGKMEPQGLLDPLPLELTPRQETLLKEWGERLEEYGFTLEPFGDRTYLLRTAPALLGGQHYREAVLEILGTLEEEQGGEAWRERISASIACHSAVRAGQTLSQEEMRELVRQLEAADSPRTCPHGRPTMIHLSAAQLEREFGRR